MRRTRERIVVETLRIDQCAKDDDVSIPYSPTGSWKSYGRVLLVKIKPISGDRVQIKFRDASLGSTVRKADLPAGLLVERTRRATEADGPDAGEPERATTVHEGVLYEATDPSVDAAQLADRIASLAAARVEPRLPASRALDASLRGGLDIGRIAMIAALSVGAGPTLIGAMRDELELRP